MFLPDIEVHEAETLDAAVTLMKSLSPDARLLAGGTDLLVDLKANRTTARHVVSLRNIDGLRRIELDTEKGLRIGAMTTISHLLNCDSLGPKFAPILDAASQMAAPQIRNMATVGGNLAAAVPCADLPPILIAMSASVVLWSPEGERRLPLESFLLGPRSTDLGDNEILTAVEVPNPSPSFGAAYERFALRNGNAIAVASVAASLQISKEGIIEAARLTLGAVAPTPKRVPAAEKLLVGQPANEPANESVNESANANEDLFEAAALAAIAAAEPICDIRGSADYRCEIVGVLTKRALGRARDRAGENQPCPA